MTGHAERAARRLVVRFVRSSSGVTAVEYGLLAAMVAFAIIVGMVSVGTSLGTTFDTVARWGFG